MARFRVLLVDVLPALLIGGLQLAGGIFATPDRPGLEQLGYVLLAASGLALVARRRAPIAVLLITALCLLGARYAGFGLMPFAVMVATYTASRAGHRWKSAIVAASFIVGLDAVQALITGAPPTGEMIRERILVVGWIVAAWVTGQAVFQADRRASQAEETREEIARRRAGEERLRIARDLHDSLTHQISIIKVQAGVAVHLARKRGEEVPAALLAIQDASTEASRELRATLEALREGEPGRHGLDRLPDLVDGARSAGLTATIHVDGEPRKLPTDVDMAAYRIVQESLTNVAKHAGPASATVSVGYGPDMLTVQIDDDGQAVRGTDPAPGVGLIGMRERVSALGGHLRAEPRPEGGFTVRAELPVPR